MSIVKMDKQKNEGGCREVVGKRNGHGYCQAQESRRVTGKPNKNDQKSIAEVVSRS